MASIDTLSPWRALVLAVLMAGVNPKNLMLTVAAAPGLAQLGVSTSEAAVSIIVFVVFGVNLIAKGIPRSLVSPTCRRPS